ncbi:MAG: helix-turn-helix transcriptional regulator, partial [Clostridia bacterium]|nr:helix-turn-helix transcriptional regulator [Clostridia bacterium]
VQLAKSVGCSQPMVVMWESGKCEPTASAIVKLAQALNCTTDYLLGVSDL